MDSGCQSGICAAGSTALAGACANLQAFDQRANSGTGQHAWADDRWNGRSAMNENRRQILEMLAAGKITADEADRLLAALDPEPVAVGQGTGSDAKSTAKRTDPK